MKRYLFLTFMILGALWSCEPQTQELPILGPVDYSSTGDTIYHTIPGFSFWDQDSNHISERFVENKVYVADFFFTSCPSICPRMKKQLQRVDKAFIDEEGLRLLSHTITPEIDSVAVLKAYADKLEGVSDKWRFLTGNQDSIFSIARSYFENMAKDSQAEGGYIHSGKFYLLDGKRRMRGYYNGTDPKEVDQLIKDIRFLLKEDKG